MDTALGVQWPMTRFDQVRSQRLCEEDRPRLQTLGHLVSSRQIQGLKPGSPVTLRHHVVIRKNYRRLQVACSHTAPPLRHRTGSRWPSWVTSGVRSPQPEPSSGLSCVGFRLGRERLPHKGVV